MAIGGWCRTASLSVKPAFSPGVWVCVHLCVHYTHDASLIFISGYKSSWLCCCAGQRAAADGGGSGVAGGCWVSTQGSPVLHAHMTPCLTTWIFMRGICCSLGNSSHLARAAALHRKWLCSWMFQNSSQMRLTPYVISQPLPLDQDTRRIKIIQRHFKKQLQQPCAVNHICTCVATSPPHSPVDMRSEQSVCVLWHSAKTSLWHLTNEMWVD